MATATHDSQLSIIGLNDLQKLKHLLYTLDKFRFSPSEWFKIEKRGFGVELPGILCVHGSVQPATISIFKTHYTIKSNSFNLTCTQECDHDPFSTVLKLLHLFCT
jgi:hypothetical protein